MARKGSWCIKLGTWCSASRAGHLVELIFPERGLGRVTHEAICIETDCAGYDHPSGWSRFDSQFQQALLSDVTKHPKRLWKGKVKHWRKK